MYDYLVERRSRGTFEWGLRMFKRGKRREKKKETKGEEGVRRNYIHTLLYEKSILVEWGVCRLELVDHSITYLPDKCTHTHKCTHAQIDRQIRVSLRLVRVSMRLLACRYERVYFIREDNSNNNDNSDRGNDWWSRRFSLSLFNTYTSIHTYTHTLSLSLARFLVLLRAISYRANGDNVR